MSDLIDREAVREFIKSYRHSTDVAFDMEKRLDEIPAASRWHRVEDELPEIGKRVLVSYGGDVQILKRTDSMTYDGKNYWWNEADGLWERVEEGSYWMPIEPPKEDA